MRGITARGTTQTRVSANLTASSNCGDSRSGSMGRLPGKYASSVCMIARDSVISWSYDEAKKCIGPVNEIDD